jgi:hypothetical protein
MKISFAFFFQETWMKGFHGKTKISHDPSIELNLQELHDLKIPKDSSSHFS